MVVLWLVAIMSLVAVTLGATVRSNLGLARAETDRLRSEALLEGSLDIAAARLIASGDKAWRIADGRSWRVTFSGGAVEIRLRDAGGLVDINRADPALIEQLIARVAGSVDDAGGLARKILERRQPPAAEGQADAAGQTNPEGAPAPAPVVAPPPFASLAELFALEGADPRVIASLMPYLGLYSRDGKVDFATAPEFVLASVPDIALEDVAGLMAARRSGSLEGQQAADILERYQQYLAHAEATVFIVDAALLGGAGLIAGTRLNATIVLDKEGEKPFRVISWSW